MKVEEEEKQYFVIDFDSTFTQVEALDILGEISLSNHPERNARLQKIKDITDLGMAGEMSLRESLIARIQLLNGNKAHLPELISRLSKLVSKSIERNSVFFNEHPENTFIISNGFKEFIVPVVTKFGIKADHVFANDMVFDEDGNIIDLNRNNVLSINGGKVKQIEALKLKGQINMIGDGYTDYEVRKAGMANNFYAYTENVEREPVKKHADHIAPSFDEILYHKKMSGALSYPKNRIKMLLLESVHPNALAKLKEEGFSVESYPAGLDEDELCEKIKGIHVLGLRSKTQVTAKVIREADKLMAMGAFCIGTNQIDTGTALEAGIPVFNAPFSNTRSVVELAIAEMISLMRGISDKNRDMHQGIWSKTAKNSFEIRGKKLGIIGYGSIGAQLSVLAENLGMDVYYYDLVEKLALGNATKCDTIEELLSIADVVSLHIDGRPENGNFFLREHFQMMKDGVIFLNLARGPVVDILALKEAILSGKVIGAGVDVFPEEPKSNNDPFTSELMGLPNTILTPHIGGSTLEAQENIADFVPRKIMDYINTGNTENSVNFPNITLPPLKDAHRLIHIHKNRPGVLAKINNTLAEFEANIVGQHLKTNETIGYVITDINKQYGKELSKAMKKIEHTIKFRMLY
ncbi:D-3-phosphoglycerate dehydrogenase [Roseivirga ehrenbergii]|uniref:D-3-phosphoglycerate dehydrogenase n=1 Tax=Roseivirga ehrenbergii (strain DSM 102268 / JCM 13514 / KCTC 12282 / NCIMB 14502 / KMM 6017) TaxID=279360 RepID=A0A150XE99_ROSEK|nr:phosphoglycerate dehydrogenase [Roseivirga ehrenbergii]KYG77028.1 3-phosphoglycerate dehydrogenase [Roseivirga ehrenbergii]TCL14471.1 D-3-phosphoglycerate dehydrogenase [Roseivirga ehrenbergii]